MTIPLAVFVLAGRQLGLGILLHDCAHRAMFGNRRTNGVVGRWLAGAPMNTSLPAYRAYHLEHHLAAGVPPYSLRKMRRMLAERGFCNGFACISDGYADALKRAVR